MSRNPAAVHLSPARIGRAETIASSVLTLPTGGEGFFDITRDALRFLDSVKAADGVLLLFLRHTSASLTIQENADPDVQTDLVTALRRLAPENAGWVHDTEGPDDMPAHVKAMLNGVCLHVPVQAAASGSARGRASMWPSIAGRRTGAKSCCNFWDRAGKAEGAGPYLDMDRRKQRTLICSPRRTGWTIR